MKNILFILALFTVLTIQGASQQPAKRTILASSAGLSLPYAEFASESLTVNSGFASAGINTEASLMRYMGSFFGLTSAIGYSNIFLSEKDYENEYDRVLYGTHQVSAGNYQILSAMGGFIFKVPEFSNTDILLMVNLGVALSFHPGLSVANSYLGLINSVKKDTDFAGISNAGIRINHWLTEQYGLSLSYSLNATRPSFDDKTSIEGHFNLPIRYQNINVGFIMKLGTSQK